MRSLLRTAFTAATVLAMTAAFVTPASAQSSASSAVAVHKLAVSQSAQTSVTDYWTAEAMRSAVPMRRLLEQVAGALQDVAGTLEEVPRGEPSVVQPTAPLGGVLGSVAGLIGSILQLGDASTGEPWTQGGAVTRTTGRIFFTFKGQRASCSGSAVTSDNRSVVITAGHCVKYQGSWHTNWVFVPGYHNGQAPYGKWPAKVTLTTPQWEASENINYDIGAAVVAPRNGMRLTEVVGGQGIAFNQPRNQHMYAFGYPVAPPYDGSRLIYCSGSTFTDFLLTDDHGMACDMTGGSSGGPWFINFDPSTGTGIVNSVSSFGYVFLPGYLFGPYFGEAAQDLYQRAESI